jgi:hypothetical protein
LVIIGVPLAVLMSLWAQVTELQRSGTQFRSDLAEERRERQALAVLVDALQRTVVRLVKTESPTPPTVIQPIVPQSAAARPEANVSEDPSGVEVSEPVNTTEAPSPEAASPPPVVRPFTPALAPQQFPFGGTHASQQEGAAADDSPSHDLEQLIGGNLLNKLGALILVIGIALFLSYSFGRTGPMGRAISGLGVSIAILVGGITLERRSLYRVYSRGIIAAGWAALYFTTYAMHSLAATRIIESPVVGVALMIATAVGMVLHSLKYRVQAMTGLAFACIYAALALSDLNAFVAISLVPLAASALYLARRFQWFDMGTFCAAATYATFVSRPASGTTLLTIESLLLLYWVMFESFDILRIAARETLSDRDHALFAINALGGLGTSAAVWYRMAPDSMWMYCVAAGSLYLLSTAIRYSLQRESRYEYSLALSSVLAGLAIFAKVPGMWTNVGLLVEAEILFLVSLYGRLRWTRILSWFAFAATLGNIRFTQGTVMVWGSSPWTPGHRRWL